MNIIERIQRITRKKSDEEIKIEKGYNPHLLATIQPQGGLNLNLITSA